jgi:hypothetical protein
VKHKTQAAKRVVAPMVQVRISAELIDRIDAIRPDLIPREPFIRHVLDIGLQQLEEEG